jgi:hypothetical protein
MNSRIEAAFSASPEVLRASRNSRNRSPRSRMSTTPCPVSPTLTLALLPTRPQGGASFTTMRKA